MVAFRIALLVALLATTSFAASVSLTWDANSESDLAGYKCYYRERTTHGFTRYTTVVGSHTTCTVTGLQPETIYIFAVTAFNNTSTQSHYSNRVSVNEPRAQQTGLYK